MFKASTKSAVIETYRCYTLFSSTCPQ